MYGSHRSRRLPRLTLTLVHALIVAGVLGVLMRAPFLDGAPGWLRPDAGNASRRAVLAALAILYLIRFSATALWLLRREIGWREVLSVGPWLGFLHGALAVLGGSNPRPLSAVVGVGAALFVAAGWLGPWSEWKRLRWKERPENRGHLYTGGPFRHVMHPNYLADVVLFTGYALATGRLVALGIPALVLAGFIFVHVPALDAYLKSKYDPEFRSYSSRTSRLIPGVW